MAKKKKGRIVIPYIITIVIGMIIIGGAALFIYNYFELGKDEELPELVGGISDEISYEDSHTVLFILETPDDLSVHTFLLMRSVPIDKNIMFVGIPSNTSASFNGKYTQLGTVYEQGGEAEAMEFVEQLFKVDINKYMTFSPDSLLEITDIFGGVTYTPDIRIPGVCEEGVERIMNGKQLEKYITFSGFPDGGMQRAFNTGSIIAAMINQSDGQRIADNLDLYFNTIVNMTDTNITAVDYKKYKSPVKYMFEKGTAIASFSYMTGSNSGDDFFADIDFCTSLKEEYFTAPENKITETEENEENTKDNSKEKKQNRIYSF